jgi:hypothetical protein
MSTWSREKRDHAEPRGQSGATQDWLDVLLARPPPESEPLARWQTRCDGVRRFVNDGWHRRATALGWTHDELFSLGTGKCHGAAWHIEDDRVLFVTDNQIMACRKDGFARPIYRGVTY